MPIFIERLERLVEFLGSLRPDEFITGHFSEPVDDNDRVNITKRDCAHCTLGWVRYHFRVEEKQVDDSIFGENVAAKDYYGLRSWSGTYLGIIAVNDMQGPRAAVEMIRNHLNNLKGIGSEQPDPR